MESEFQAAVSAAGGANQAMAEKSRRRELLERSLAEDPGDPFLRYGLAMQCLREGETAEGRERLKALIADHPETQIASYQQLGQSYAEARMIDEARAVLVEGIKRALAAGDDHAAAEMRGLHESLN